MMNPSDRPLLEALLDSWDRNNTILVNLLRAIPEGGLDARVIAGSPSVAEMFTHMHYVRLVFVFEDAPEFARPVPEEEWVATRDPGRMADWLNESAQTVRDAVKGRVEAGRDMDLHYDHPILLLQHMLWHEGYHHGQIKLALKVAGLPMADREAGPITWGVWMRKKRSALSQHTSPRTERHQERLRQLPIETASLTLRALVPEDGSKIFQMSQEDGMRTWLPSQVYRDEAHAKSVLDILILKYSEPGDPRVGPYVLGIQLKGTGELVGHVGFGPLDEAVEVGFAIESAHQRKGIATLAVRAACEWAADAFSLGTIFAVTATQNSASQGVLLHAGFARQKQEVMRFQGHDQPVIYFAFARKH